VPLAVRQNAFAAGTERVSVRHVYSLTNRSPASRALRSIRLRRSFEFLPKSLTGRSTRQSGHLVKSCISESRLAWSTHRPFVRSRG
jgi:hypothetical protein